MKHYYKLILLALVLCAVGCNNSDPNPGPDIDPEIESDYMVEDENFRIQAQVTPTTAEMTITPTDETMFYWAGFYSKEVLDTFWGGDVLNIARDLIVRATDFYGEGEALAAALEGILRRGEYFTVVTDMTPGLDMVAYAVGMDRYGEIITEPLILNFKTSNPPEPVRIDCTFDFEVSELTRSTAVITITPSNDTVDYFFDVTDKDTYDKYAEMENGMAQYFADRYAQEMKTTGMDFYWLIGHRTLLHTGEEDVTQWGMMGGRTYYMIACAVDEYGQIISDFGTDSLTTPPVELSDMTFEVTISDITAGGATFNVVPSNDQDPYLPVPFPASEIAELSDDQVIVSAQEKMGLSFDYSRRSGSSNDRDQTLLPDTDYMLTVFGYDGGRTTDVKRVPFRTLAAGDPADCQFNIAVEPLPGGEAHLVITPSDGSVSYLYQYVPASEFTTAADLVEARKREIEATVQSLIDSGSAVTVATWVRGLSMRGTLDTPVVNLQPDTEYVVCAYAVNEDASNASEVAEARFTTLSVDIGAGMLQIAYDKFFDGNQILALNPDAPEMFKDGCIFPVTITPNEDAVHWYVFMFWGDVTNASVLTDMIIINSIMGQEKRIDDAREYDFRTAWVSGRDESVLMTVCGVAVDAEGKYGPVCRVALPIVTHGACSPASEYVPASERSGVSGLSLMSTYATLLPASF